VSCQKLILSGHLSYANVQHFILGSFIQNNYGHRARRRMDLSAAWARCAAPTADGCMYAAAVYATSTPQRRMIAILHDGPSGVTATPADPATQGGEDLGLLCPPPIKAYRPLTRYTLNAPWLLTNRQFQWTGNGYSQLPLVELGKPSPNIDLLRTTGSNGRA